MTSEEIAAHGTSAMWGHTEIMPYVSRTMPPQSGSGGGMPMPRKPRTPMRIVLYPMRSHMSTRSGPRALGRISTTMMYSGDSPRIFAAETYSRSRSSSVSPRTMR